LLFSLRSEALAMTPALDEWLLGLRRNVPVAQIDLGPLSFEDTVQLLQALGPKSPSVPESEEVARWIFTETRGQPFYIVETLRTLLERGASASPRGKEATWTMDLFHPPEQSATRAVLPPSVRQIIQVRLAPLPQTARDLLAAASVLGQGFTFELLCDVGRLTEDEALPALDSVVRGNLLHETHETERLSGGGEYVFAHD
jgi:predicted ATPase